jgi:hypothetical protein
MTRHLRLLPSPASIDGDAAGHLLVTMGWTGQRVAGGGRVFRRPSPIARGRYCQPWLLSVPEDPDAAASRDRWARWNRAVGIFALVAGVYLLAWCVL